MDRITTYTIAACILGLILAGCEMLGQTEVFELTVQTHPEEVASAEPSSRQYEEGSRVTLSTSIDPIQSVNYQFIQWVGDVSSDENPYTFEIRQNTHAVAFYDWQEYSLTIQIEGSGEIINQEIVGARSGFDGGPAIYNPDKDYQRGAVVRLEAAADPEWNFCFWQGEDFQFCSADNPTREGRDITIWDDQTVTAVFRRAGDSCGPCISPDPD